MSETLRSLLAGFVDAARSLFAGEEERDAAAAVRLAAATLLAEMARVDGKVTQADLRAARDALCTMFALSADGAQALIERAGRTENRPTSYFPAVSVLNRHLSAEQKVQFVEQLWRVANADREIDVYEDHLVRKIADLLYVPHADFISSKLRVKRAG
ncbi:MAG TPA: TerB family tellurite resistance protein [Burkholderiales bacterium]|nr:TerB family tellurite resistance protein [Burkholderiales bacterium]